MPSPDILRKTHSPPAKEHPESHPRSKLEALNFKGGEVTGETFSTMNTKGVYLLETMGGSSHCVAFGNRHLVATLHGFQRDELEFNDGIIRFEGEMKRVHIVGKDYQKNDVVVLMVEEDVVLPSLMFGEVETPDPIAVSIPGKNMESFENYCDRMSRIEPTAAPIWAKNKENERLRASYIQRVMPHDLSIGMGAGARFKDRFFHKVPTVAGKSGCPIMFGDKAVGIHLKGDHCVLQDDFHNEGFAFTTDFLDYLRGFEEALQSIN
eukprot:TRINITY_DN1647_c0_g1_i1.p1 TRINITY_DN1647_c0_g1~~TRINITY_DN1647_c0_g1_i1.p1  ORF type:complete len:272 (-),score=54.82 TRINITY_DN1647_c0_g1_i1:304-1098(-)